MPGLFLPFGSAPGSIGSILRSGIPNLLNGCESMLHDGEEEEEGGSRRREGAGSQALGACPECGFISQKEHLDCINHRSRWGGGADGGGGGEGGEGGLKRRWFHVAGWHKDVLLSAQGRHDKYT